MMRLAPWIAFLLAVVALSPAMADDNDHRWVEVTGEGDVTAAPDFARITLGVTTTAPNAGDAVAANAKAASALVALIKAEGVAPADIQTSNLSISPMFSQPPRGETTPPTIESYSVNNNLTVIVRDIPKLGALLDKAVGAGANSVYGVSFGHSDPGALLDKARPLAVADARRKAEIYATADGAKIGRLIKLTEGAGSHPPIGFARAFAANAAAPTPIEAGEDKLTIGVTARFELTQ
jgi:uncharacterized protein